eukprot:COSAG02_NODE_4856_length_4899_cov_2.376667_6_plen_104_part_00
MKVGSLDPQDDVLRARAIREEIGEDNFLMMDANQKWDVPEAIECMKMLAPYAKSRSLAALLLPAISPFACFSDIQITGTNPYGSKSPLTVMISSATEYAEASP